jgi:hypothetical protein
MIVISDSDIVRKLAHCNLLNDLLNIWQIPPNTLWVLPALRAQLTRVFGAAEVQTGRLAHFFSMAKEIPQASFQTLERCFGNGLDVGEQQMLAVLLDRSDVKHLITGDRNALRQIGHLCHSDAPMRQRLEETTIWCFESVLANIIRRRGFDAVRRNVHAWIATDNEVDKAISAIFHHGCQAADAAVGLEERIGVLRKSTAGLPIQS